MTDEHAGIVGDIEARQSRIRREARVGHEKQTILGQKPDVGDCAQRVTVARPAFHRKRIGRHASQAGEPEGIRISGPKIKRSAQVDCESAKGLRVRRTGVVNLDRAAKANSRSGIDDVIGCTIQKQGATVASDCGGASKTAGDGQRPTAHRCRAGVDVTGPADRPIAAAQFGKRGRPRTAVAERCSQRICAAIASRQCQCARSGTRESLASRIGEIQCSGARRIDHPAAARQREQSIRI